MRTGLQKQNTFDRYTTVLALIDKQGISIHAIHQKTGINKTMLFVTVHNLIDLNLIEKTGKHNSKNALYKLINNNFTWDDYYKIYKGHEKHVDGASSVKNNPFHDYPFLIKPVPVNRSYVTQSRSSDDDHINIRLADPRKYFVSGTSLGMF